MLYIGSRLSVRIPETDQPVGSHIIIISITRVPDAHHTNEPVLKIILNK